MEHLPKIKRPYRLMEEDSKLILVVLFSENNSGTKFENGSDLF